jgi:hypothetical protein
MVTGFTGSRKLALCWPRFKSGKLCGTNIRTCLLPDHPSGYIRGCNHLSNHSQLNDIGGLSAYLSTNCTGPDRTDYTVQYNYLIHSFLLRSPMGAIPIHWLYPFNFR